MLILALKEFQQMKPEEGSELTRSERFCVAAVSLERNTTLR